MLQSLHLALAVYYPSRGTVPDFCQPYHRQEKMQDMGLLLESRLLLLLHVSEESTINWLVVMDLTHASPNSFHLVLPGWICCFQTASL